MKYLIIATLLINTAFAQKLDIEVDKFTGQKRIETKSRTPIQEDFKAICRIKYRSVGNTFFITLSGSGGAGVVGLKDGATFLFDDKTQFVIYPTSIQTFDIEKEGNFYDHQYLVSREQLDLLATKKLIAVRRYYSSNYMDHDVKEKNSAKIIELTKLFLSGVDAK